MILRFRHRGLERLHWRGDTSGVSAQHVKRLRAVLAALETALVPSDMALPGCPAASAPGRPRRAVVSHNFGQLARGVRVRGPQLTNVDLIDYH
jgi:proteic killer suppression protein